MLDRTIQPDICEPAQLDVQRPKRMSLPNGITLNILDACDSEVTRVDIVMEGGRWHQEQLLQALFANRMLREGTRRYTAAGIAEQLDYYGAWLDLSSAPLHTYITLYSLNKYLPQTLDLLESMVKEPLYPEKELKVVLDANVDRFKVNMSKVDFLAQRELVRVLFGGQHPAGQLVNEADYRSITPEVLRRFYHRHYHSQNCTIYLSGRVTDDCIRRVEALFGSEPFGWCGERPLDEFLPPVADTGRRVFVEREGALQSAVRIGMLTIDRCHPDYLEYRVLVTLLGGYFGSRLMSNIREEKGYTYGIAASYASYPGQGVLAVSAETANRYVEPLIAEVYREIARLQAEPVSPAELAMVKNYMLGDMCRSCESAFSLADGWIFLQSSGLGETYFSDAMQAVKDTTPDDLLRLARTYLRTDELHEVVVGAC